MGEYGTLDAGPGPSRSLVRWLLASAGGALTIAVVAVVAVMLPIEFERQRQDSEEGCSGVECALSLVLPPEVTWAAEGLAAAAKAFGVPAPLLASTWMNESGGSDGTTGCDVPGICSGLNFAGCCGGPFQFDPRTFAAYEDAYKEVERCTRGRYRLFVRPRTRRPSLYDPYYAIPAAAAYFADLGVGSRVDERTYEALLYYKGRPPYSAPYARMDYELARRIERQAVSAGIELSTCDLTLDVTFETEGAASCRDLRPRSLRRMICVADFIDALDLQYCWGGGHGPQPGPSRIVGDCWSEDRADGRTHTAVGIDCSGALRWLMVLSGFPDPGPIVSSQFAGVYPLGPGRRVTFWGNAAHVFVEIDGRMWGTSTRNPASGPGWVPRGTEGFVASHPDGL